MADNRLDLRVGLFVFVSLAALSGMIIMFGLRDIKLLHDTYRVTGVFKFTNGVVVGAPVRFTGVEAGKVGGIEFAKDGSNDVYLHMHIRNGVIVRKDARLIVNSLGIMGEKYLEIIPRSATEEPLRSGDKLRGEEPLPLNDVVDQTYRLISEARATFHEIFDASTRQDLKAILSNVRGLTGDETRDSLDRILKNIEALTGDETKSRLQEILVNVERLTGESTRRKLEDVLEKFQTTAATVADLIEGEREDIEALIMQWHDISRSLNQVMNSIKNSEGTLGLLVSSPEVHTLLRDVLKNLNQWIALVRKHGLLYKEKSDRRVRAQDNRGVFKRR